MREWDTFPLAEMQKVHETWSKSSKRDTTHLPFSAFWDIWLRLYIPHSPFSAIWDGCLKLCIIQDSDLANLFIEDNPVRRHQ